MNTQVIELQRNGENSNHDLDALLWVAKAQSKDLSRLILNAIHIKDNLAVATDGRRIHCAKLEGKFNNGNYKVWRMTSNLFFAVTKDFEAVYPKWQSVIPKLEKDDDLEKIYVKYKAEKESKGIRDYQLANAVQSLIQANFNLDYLREATDKLFEFYVYQKSQTDPVLIQDKPDNNWQRQAVIMPVIIGYIE